MAETDAFREAAARTRFERVRVPSSDAPRRGWTIHVPQTASTAPRSPTISRAGAWVSTRT
ncbi:MAG: hypothetical protein EON88_01555 [Brevundimonas sp.]|nr:MAG: hypothetical protein EON88_01555 [Brevundimonas sp.]